MKTRHIIVLTLLTFILASGISIPNALKSQAEVTQVYENMTEERAVTELYDLFYNLGVDGNVEKFTNQLHNIQYSYRRTYERERMLDLEIVSRYICEVRFRNNDWTIRDVVPVSIPYNTIEILNHGR